MKFIGGKKQAVTYICTQWCDISVQKNREYDDEHYLVDPKNFLYWKYYLDIEPNNIEENEYIKKVSNLLGYIKDHCNDAIAACDFEDKLRIFMNDSMLNSFHEIYLDKNNLLSYKNYYNALRLWVKKNEKNLSSRLQYMW